MRPREENSSAIRLGVGALDAAASAGAGLGLGVQSSTATSAGGSDFSEGAAGARFQPVAAPSAAAASSEAQTSGLAGPRNAAPAPRRPSLVSVLVTAPNVDDLGFAPVKPDGLAFARAFP